MGARRIKCACGETFKLEDEEEWGTLAAKDRLLDMHSAHRSSKRQSGR